MHQVSVPPPVWILTALLAVSTLLSSLDRLPWIVHVLSLVGPAGVIWMVLHVLRDRSVPIRELAEGDAWGYQDRPDVRPGR